jgi:hypothetical protein
MVAAGSTIITLNEAYLNSLGNGTHNFTANFAGGVEVDIPLTVNVVGGGTGSGADGNPQTGVTLVIVPILLSGLAGGTALVARKRR